MSDLTQQMLQIDALIRALSAGKADRAEKIIRGKALVVGKRVSKVDLIDPYECIKSEGKMGKLSLNFQSVASLVLKAISRGEDLAVLMKLPEMDLEAAIARHGRIPLIAHVRGEEQPLDLFGFMLHPVISSGLSHSAVVAATLALVSPEGWSKPEIRQPLFQSVGDALRRNALYFGDCLSFDRSMARYLNMIFAAVCDDEVSAFPSDAERSVFCGAAETQGQRASLLHMICACDMKMFAGSESNHATEVAAKVLDQAARDPAMDTVAMINAMEGNPGSRLLHRAVLMHNVSLVRELLRRGADPMAKNAAGRTAREECQALPEPLATLLSAAEAAAEARRAVAEMMAPTQSKANTAPHAP